MRGLGFPLPPKVLLLLVRFKQGRGWKALLCPIDILLICSLGKTAMRVEQAKVLHGQQIPSP